MTCVEGTKLLTPQNYIPIAVFKNSMEEKLFGIDYAILFTS